MPNTHEQKFTNALRDIFVGAKIEGESGYINLMRIKSRYYTEGVFPKLMEKIDEEIKPFPAFREELFDKLFTFFKRYFSESGSIYFRHTPYYQDIYERIYTDDRDVMLFWKTQNLYYVKTDRLFRSLTVSLDDAPDQKFAFDASAVAKQTFDFDASTLQNKRNNEKRNLVFSYEGVGENEMLKFAVNYSQGATKTKVDDILKAIKKDGVKVNEDQLIRAFRLFERQSEVDFFINKNAKTFLNEQFDLWMYQYLFKNDSTDWNDKRIKQMQALKRVAYAIIEFIAQFEDELVRIWNKPKFALASNYVITFDRVFGKSEDTARKLLAHEGIAAQIEEWRTLGIIEDDFAVERIFEQDAETKPKAKKKQIKQKEELPFDSDAGEAETELETIEDADDLPTLSAKYRYLPFDTKHFKSLEIEILSLFDNLDEELDGRLVHSENYQALNTLKDKFREKVKCIYIDPPYNTERDGFDYVDNFKKASWLSMIFDRVFLSNNFLNQAGLFTTSIDDKELASFQYILNSIFSTENFLQRVIWKKRGGAPNDKKIGSIHEYLILFAKSLTNLNLNFKTRNAEQLSRYSNPDNHPKGKWAEDNLMANVKGGRYVKSLYFSIVNPNTGEGHFPNNNGNWRFNSEKIAKLLANNEIYFGKDGKGRPKLKRFLDDVKEGVPFSTIWDYLPQNNSASQEIEDLFSDIGIFETPKPTGLISELLKLSTNKEETIFDYFGGSGTTAHAVINLNREDGGRRKYILVEANDYFHTVILPRVKKVVFSDKWKDGKAQAGGKGVSHFCKYFALEQYEDTLRRASYVNDRETDAPSFFDNPYESPFASYVFLRDKKMSDALKVDYEADKITVDFQKLYPEIDWAETLSCIKGKFIKNVSADSVTFEDNETVKFSEIDYRDILPLIWWDK